MISIWLLRLAACGRLPGLPPIAGDHLGCGLTHARRKFYEAVNDLPKPEQAGSVALEGQQYCNRLFAIEKELAGLTPEERHTAAGTGK